MSWDDEERERRVPSWSWGWGSGAGMWQEGGNSCLPRAWVSIKQVFSSGQGPVLVPPAVARGCPRRWAGPKENSQQRKGPLWRAEDGCRTRGGCQSYVAREVAGRCCHQVTPVYWRKKAQPESYKFSFIQGSY